MSPEVASNLLEKYMDHLQNDQPPSNGLIDIEAAGKRYKIDFGEMCQTNQETGKMRSIRYLFEKPPNWTTLMNSS